MKKITLPQNNFPIFEALAQAECRRQKVSTTPENVESFVYEFAEEAYLHSFTPSEELGKNPNTPKIAESFYKEFDDIFADDGWFASKMKGQGIGLIKEKSSRFKGGMVNLVQLYMELGYGFKTKNKRAGLNTDFDYPTNLDEHISPEEYKKLLRVEENKYARLYAATIMTDVILAVFRRLDEDMLQNIANDDLWNVEDIKNPEERFKILKSSKNRREFVRKVRKTLTVGTSEE